MQSLELYPLMVPNIYSIYPQALVSLIFFHTTNNISGMEKKLWNKRLCIYHMLIVMYVVQYFDAHFKIRH